MAQSTMDELLVTLYEMIQDARPVPLSGDKCMIEREKALDILDELRANLPSEIKMSKEIVEKRNDIIASAKKEYDVTLKRAEEIAKQRLNENDLTSEARRKASDIIAVAETRAREIMKSAGEYCEDAMKRTEEAVARTLEEVRHSRVDFKTVLREQNQKQ